MPLCIFPWVQDHAIPYWKDLRGGKYFQRELIFGNTINICQDIMKSANLLHKQGFDDSQSSTTVQNENLACLAALLLNSQVLSP